MEKRDIHSAISQSVHRCENLRIKLTDKASILEYTDYVTVNESGEKIWTSAFKEALARHSVVHIPYSHEPYLIDGTITVPKDRWIIADKNACIKRAPGFVCVMLRNENNSNGSHMPEPNSNRDSNITVSGGIWDGSCSGYMHTPYSNDGSFHGVSACIFINHADFVTIKDITVINSGEFAVQVGDITNAHFESIHFRDCYADGLHIGGNTYTLSAKNIKGDVGDDLVALNAFDWERSSVNFGAISCVLCDGLELDEKSKYKALRILPGRYFYRDGSVSECDIKDIIIRNVRGINTFKLYFQRDSHLIYEKSNYGAPGKADNIYFEDIEATLDSPIDSLEPYLTGSTVNGQFSIFELGSETGSLFFENIKVCIDKEKHPMSYLIQVGAKSVRIGDREIFDPEIGGNIKKLELSDIYINGKTLDEKNLKEYICEIRFDDIYEDGKSSSLGKIQKIIIK